MFWVALLRQKWKHAHTTQKTADIWPKDLWGSKEIKPDLREVQFTLVNQWVYNAVHDWHQNQDQDGVDSLVKKQWSHSLKAYSKCTTRQSDDQHKGPYLHLFRLDDESSLLKEQTDRRSFKKVFVFLFLDVSSQGNVFILKSNSYKVAIHGGRLEGPSGALQGGTASL